MLSSLNLAALQQANKRRRAIIARSPSVSRSPSPPGDGEQVTVGKAPAENPRDFANGALGGTGGNRQGIGEEPVAATNFSAPASTTASASYTGEGSSRVEESNLGGGTATSGECVGGGGGDGGGCAALLARNGGATFVLVAKEHLVGTWLAVFVRASMLHDVSDIRTGMYLDKHKHSAKKVIIPLKQAHG